MPNNPSFQKTTEPQAPLTPSSRQTAKVEAKELRAYEAYQRGETRIRDLVAPAAFKVNTRFLNLGSQYVTTIYVITYPRYMGVGWFAPVINLNLPLDISMFFYPAKVGEVLKQLRKKVGALEVQIYSDAEKGAPRDPIRETALRDIEKLRDDLTQGTEKFFQFALYVSIYSSDPKELEDAVDKVESLFASKLVYTKRVFFQAELGFNSTLPLNNDELLVYFNMNSSPCASSFPFVSAEVTSDEGILYGINRHNNSLILFDRFSLQNPNAVVFATAGAGKSYAVKLEVLRSLMIGTDVIIIDPENEYKFLAETVGGTYMSVSLNSEAKINPFDLPRPVGGADRPADIIRSAVITIKGLLRIMLQGPNPELAITPEEDSLIDRALIETYSKKDITADADLSTVVPPTMADFQSILEGMEGSKNILERLKKYTEGTFAGLFNSPTNIRMDNQLVVFSVRDLEDELRPMGVYLIINYIWNVVRSQMKKRIMIIDEAWWLMLNEDSAKFIYALVKRCRKYYLGVTTITQDVNDFLQNRYGQAIINNSAMAILMKQAPAAIDLVGKTFALTEGEKYVLLESGVGEGIFFAGSKHAAIKVVASLTEDQIITTDPKQRMEIEAAKKEFEEERNLSSQPS